MLRKKVFCREKCPRGRIRVGEKTMRSILNRETNRRKSNHSSLGLGSPQKKGGRAVEVGQGRLG